MILFRSCLVLAILIVRVGAAQAANDCRPEGTPKISVQTEKPGISYDQALSRAGILALARLNDPSAGKGYDGLLGITDTKLKRAASLQLAIVGDPIGGYCISFQSIDVTLSWEITVHVESQLKPGSCMFRVVSTHEQGHVDIDLQATEYGRKLIGKAIAPLAGQAVSAATPEAGTNLLKQMLIKKLDAAFSNLETELKRRQKAHDTPEEYAKPAKICGMEENNRALRD